MNKNTTATISAVINTRNASQHLAEVIAALDGFDEILVCDMESTDDTLEIARSLGCRTVTFPKGDHHIAEPARDFALRQASGDWVLVVDADEIVSPQLKEYLREFIAAPDAADGLLIPRCNHFMNIFLRPSYPDYQLRFFRRELTTWPPVIHSRPVVNGRVEKIPANRMDLALYHIAPDMMSMVDRMNRYTTDEVKRRAGKKAGLWQMITQPAFRFFKTYFMKGAWRYGTVGFIMAQKEAVYRFYLLAKIYEKRHSS